MPQDSEDKRPPQRTIAPSQQQGHKEQLNTDLPPDVRARLGNLNKGIAGSLPNMDVQSSLEGVEAAIKGAKAESEAQQGVEPGGKMETVIDPKEVEKLRAQPEGNFVKPQPTKGVQPTTQNSDQALNLLLQRLTPDFEAVQLPSRGRFYEGLLPPDGKIHVRKMTIQEEKILATPRLLKSGIAIDKVFENCISEEFNPGSLITADRTYLLIYIRGISYGPNYEVTIRCPGCGESWSEDIDLDSLPLTLAGDDVVNPTTSVLPESQLAITWRFPTGDDERQLLQHRSQRIRGFGAEVIDDTDLLRASILIQQIEQFSERAQIETILSNLPVRDSNYLKSLFDELPFGIDTNLSIDCPFCSNTFELGLPMDASFFYPRTKKAS